MAQREPRQVPAAVDAVRQRIEEWRSTREKRTQMPEDLWEAAASVAGDHGLWAVSRALRVNYESLKKRCGQEGARSLGDGKAARAAGFVELKPSHAIGSADQSGTIVEFSRPDGAKLTIRVAAGDTLDVSALTERFWERAQ